MNIFDVIYSDPTLVAEIQKAVCVTLKLYTHSEVEARPPIKQVPGRSDPFVVGYVRLTGQTGSGILALAMSEEAFGTIYQNMFGEKLTVVTADEQNLAGELINIIFQTFDPELRTRGHLCEVSLPEILAGDSLKNWHRIVSKRALLLPFAMEKGDLYFEIPEVTKLEID